MTRPMPSRIPADKFGATVAVEVGHKKLRIVRSRTYVFAEVDAPQTRSVKFITVEICRSGESVVCIVMRIRRIPFKDYLILAVAVDIPNRSIVGIIEILFPKRVHSEFRTLYGYVDISLRGIGRKCVCAVPEVALSRADFIDSLRVARIGVLKKCHVGQRLGVKLLAVAENVEGLVFGIRLQIAPRHRHFFRILTDGHYSATEILAPHLRKVVV